MTTLTGGPTRQPSPSPDNAQIGNAAVADPDAITYSAPAAAAAATAASPAVTVGAALGAFTDPPSAAEMGALRTFVNALKTDNAALKAEFDKVVTDLATRRTEINAVRTQLIADAADLASVRTKLIALLTSLESATPNPLLPT